MGGKGMGALKLPKALPGFVGCVKGTGSGQLFLFRPLYPADKVFLFLVLEMWGHCKEQGMVIEDACNCMWGKMVCNIFLMTLK